MNKYFLALFFLLVHGYCSYAQQIDFSLTAGINQSNILHNMFSEPFTKGLNAGVVVNYSHSDKWQLHGGLMYSEKGNSFQSKVIYGSDLTDITSPRILNKRHYLTLPTYVSYQKSLSEKLTFYPMLGIFQGILLHHEVNEIIGNAEPKRVPDKLNIRMYDAGLLLGAGLSYKLNDRIKINAEYKLEPSLTSQAGPIISLRNGTRNLNSGLNFSFTISPFGR